MRLFRPHRHPKGLEPKNSFKAINAIVANTASKAPSGTFEDTTAPIRAKIATLVPMYPTSRHDTYPEEWCRTTPETARQPLSHGEAGYFLHGKAVKASRLRSVQQDRRKQNPAAETQQSRQESSQ